MLLECKPRARWGRAGALLATVLLLMSAVPASASETSLKSEAEAFADEHIPRQLADHRIPGAAVAVASDQGLLFAQGYGLADVEEDRPVDAESTVFAPASVGKLITATAVMQLVEDGRIDLDTDVNEYLTDVAIDDAYPGQPVTAAHLLTHTAGFAAGDFGTGAPEAAEVAALGEHLAAHQPDRIRPPGTRAVYSNYGMGLAGYLVEMRSGQPFHEYVRDRILTPLGMSNTTFAQPEPEPIADGLAPGYRLSDGRQVRAKGALYGHMPPHGPGFRSTATDMAAFMQAHLDGGGAILTEESIRLMQSRRFGNAEGTAGMGYGFQEYFSNGHRLLVHRGNVPGYVAIFALLPESGLGIYASYNGSGDGGADSVWALVDAFAERFGAKDEHPVPGATRESGALPDPAGFTGVYRQALADDTADLGRLGAFTSVVTVTADADGTVTTTGPVAHGPAETRRWVQRSPGVFQEEDGGRVIQFGDDGLLATEKALDPLIRLSWYQLPGVHLAAFGVSMVVLVGSALGTALVYLIRKIRRRPSKGPRLAGLPGWVCAVSTVASFGALAAMFADFEGNQAAFFLGGSPLFTAIWALPIAAAFATAAALVTAVPAWRNGWWSRAGRVHATVVVLAALVCLGLAAVYNVIG